MTAPNAQRTQDLARRLTEAEAIIEALLSGEIDAVVDSETKTPVLLAKAQEALRTSEERYRRIVETTNEGVWLIDGANKTTFMNRQMAHMLGCEPESCLGRSPFEFLGEAGRVTLASYLRSGDAGQVELEFMRADGKSGWGLLEMTPEFDVAGQYLGSLAMVMDITARKHVEAALRASEGRFRRLWDSGIILITISDVGGRISEVNDAGVRLLGYSREELLALRWDDITPEEWRDADQAARAQLAATGVASPWEKEIIRKDGTRVSILSAAAVLGGVEGIAIAVDLTDRKRAEKDLLERMRIAALTADVGMVLTHDAALRTMLDRCADAVVQHLDVAFARIWTVNRKDKVLELQGSAGLPAQPDDPDARVPIGQRKVGRVAEQRRPYRTNDVPGDSRAGDHAWKGVTAFAGHPLLVNEELVGVLAIFARAPISDAAFAGLGAISDAVAVAIQRRVVTSTNAALESQLRQSQKMEAVGRLAGGIAHDFNNILSVILTCGQFLLDDMKTVDPARADVEEIRKAAERAAGLTRQLLMFSRQQVLEPKVVDLTAVTANLEHMLRRVLGEDVELVLLNEPNLGRVRVDLGSIEQLIMNLAVNARDAMPTGGKLTIATTNESSDGTLMHVQPVGAVPGRQVVLAVTDTGTGMDAATQARIFEPFFTTKEVGKGTGLGLSTAFGIVEQSNGTIHVQSESGKGTTFSISLPYVDAALDAPAVEPKEAFGGTETILLVEDDDQVRAVARAILQRHGYRVIEIRAAAEALAYCQTCPDLISLLLTDVVMPQMSGPELGRQLVAVRPKLKVLCMSGYTDDSIVRHGVMQTHIAFLPKPFTSQSLTRKVREVLDGPS
jgi:two-component system cell cycle sensor histidine kinase/response regulator CckA